MDKNAGSSLLANLDERAVAEFSSILFDESRRGATEASARLSQTRADVFAKIAELEGELERRNPSVSIEAGQRQVAMGLIIELAANLKAVIASGGVPIEQKLRNARDAFGAFEKKLAKVLEAVAVLQESRPVTIDVIDQEGFPIQLTVVSECRAPRPAIANCRRCSRL